MQRAVNLQDKINMENIKIKACLRETCWFTVVFVILPECYPLPQLIQGCQENAELGLGSILY